MRWDDNLPDVGEWQPNANQKDTLSNGLQITCQAAQNRIITETRNEKIFNRYNFNSGLGVEDVVRQELAKLLPSRYYADAGVVNDSDGNTAEDVDIVVRNELWAPVVKPGATPTSRQYHFPIESIYAAIEVKQTLNFKTLDQAMKKLVTLSRLNRLDNPYGHITENQHIENFDKEGKILNPLRTTVLAIGLGRGISFDDLAKRFDRINAGLRRNEMVTDLYVLDHGTASYSWKGNDGRYKEADFTRDRSEVLILSTSDKKETKGDIFYYFYVALLGHLTRSVLRIHELHDKYGRRPIYDFRLNERASYNSP